MEPRRSRFKCKKQRKSEVQREKAGFETAQQPNAEKSQDMQRKFERTR